LEAWQDKPVFGWGPNNYFYAFNKFYRPEFLESGWGETWFDNAHNVIVNTLAVQGGVGILTYLGMFGLGIVALWGAYRKKQIDVHLASVGSAFLVAHLISLVTVFENPTSYLYFFFFIAFVNSQVTSYKLQVANKEQYKALSIGLISTVAIISLLFIYVTNINPSRANKNTLLAIRGLYQSQDGAQLFKLAESVPSPHIDDIRNDFVRTAIQAIPQLMQNKQPEQAKALFDICMEKCKKIFYYIHWIFVFIFNWHSWES